MRPRSFLLLGTLALSLGCWQGETPAGVPYTVEHVPNLDSLLPIISETRLLEDPTHPIARITSLAVLPSGSIVIADAGAREVKVFDAQGRYVGLLGHAGSGPGEYATPVSVALWPNRDAVIVTDFGQPRFLVFPRDTSMEVRTVSLPTSQILARTVRPWHGDSLIAAGVVNRWTGDSLYDGVLLSAEGTVGRKVLKRPATLEGRGLAVTMIATLVQTTRNNTFYAASLFPGIFRSDAHAQRWDSLLLSTELVSNLSLPDTSPKGQAAMAALSKSLTILSDLQAIDDSTLVLTVRHWDAVEDEPRFQVLAVSWGTKAVVAVAPACDCRLYSQVGDTLVTIRGSVGDTVRVQKRLLRRAVFGGPR